MGKKEKEHRKKVAKRNEQINQQKRKMEKIHKENLMKLIEMEKQKGMFNAPVTNIPGFEGPSLGSINPPISGPQI